MLVPHTSPLVKCSLPNIYCPQHNCGKVMFLHMFVILSTGWVSGRQPLLGRHPLADTPQGRNCLADTTPPPGQTLPWQTPPGRPPLPRQTLLDRHPLADTPPGRHPLNRQPLGRHPLADTPPGRHPPEQTPPGQTPPFVDTPRDASYWNAFLLPMIVCPP